MLKGTNIQLRPVEPWDVDKLLEWENNHRNWRISGTMVPFSKELIMRYIENAQDIFAAQQVRFIVTEIDSLTPIGAIDLFEFSPKHQRAGVGILIDESYRGKGYAMECLQLIEEYALSVVGIRNLWCNILQDNEKSQSLFEKAGYVHIGTKVKWFNDHVDWLDELMYQKQLV